MIKIKYNDFSNKEYLEKIFTLQSSNSDNRGGRSFDNVKKHVAWLSDVVFINAASKKKF